MQKKKKNKKKGVSFRCFPKDIPCADSIPWREPHSTKAKDQSWPKKTLTLLDLSRSRSFMVNGESL
jgi:hypothetical protein